MKVLRLLCIAIFLLAFNLQYAQEDDGAEDNVSLESGTIDSQFEYIFKKSGNFKGLNGAQYEAVRTLSLDKLRKNVIDTLTIAYKKEAELKGTIAGHETTISGLNKKLNDTTNSLTTVTEEKDSMSFLGILVSKITYNTILWSIIAGLLGLTLFFMFKFRSSNVLTQEARSNLSELETEYEDHRRRALEREQKISRQLQDEINRYKKSK
ncbi:MAG: tRNA (guanine-N1)-methyltransferase [Flavobacteriaceae bacterium]